jgi:hypothetical protein
LRANLDEAEAFLARHYILAKDTLETSSNGWHGSSISSALTLLDSKNSV